jgi:hypothetical protein
MQLLCKGPGERNGPVQDTFTVRVGPVPTMTEDVVDIFPRLRVVETVLLPGMLALACCTMFSQFSQHYKI